MNIWTRTIHLLCETTCVSLITAFLLSSVPSLPAGCATSSLVTVDTSTSWSVIDMVASTNITESGVPMLSPSRCSRCVESSNESCRVLPQPPSLHLLQLQQLLPTPSHSEHQPVLSALSDLRLSGAFVLFCCHIKTKRDVKEVKKEGMKKAAPD